eukprot:PhF_6_TR6202/c0_g1_i1/m.9332
MLTYFRILALIAILQFTPNHPSQHFSKMSPLMAWSYRLNSYRSNTSTLVPSEEVSPSTTHSLSADLNREMSPSHTPSRTRTRSSSLSRSRDVREKTRTISIKKITRTKTFITKGPTACTIFPTPSRTFEGVAGWLTVDSMSNMNLLYDVIQITSDTRNCNSLPNRTNVVLNSTAKALAPYPNTTLAASARGANWSFIVPGTNNISSPNFRVCYYASRLFRWTALQVNWNGRIGTTFPITPCNPLLNCSNASYSPMNVSTSWCNCNCFPGYIGDTCRKNCTIEDSCSGNAVSVERVESNNTCRCQCLLGYSGSDCSIREPCNAIRDCHGRSLSISVVDDRPSGCNCDCMAPYGGDFCTEGNGTIWVVAYPYSASTDVMAELYDAMTIPSMLSEYIWHLLEDIHTVLPENLWTVRVVQNTLYFNASVKDLTERRSAETNVSKLGLIANYQHSRPFVGQYVGPNNITLTWNIRYYNKSQLPPLVVNASNCPPRSPYLCWDGTCVDDRDKCQCHPLTQLCNNQCVPKHNLENLTICPTCDFVMCANGTCALDWSQCKCAAGMTYCSKVVGCVWNDVFPLVQAELCPPPCPTPKVRCWNDQCVDMTSQCPCEPITPYRCSDNVTCVADLSYCAVVCSYPLTRCRNGTCGS